MAGHCVLRGGSDAPWQHAGVRPARDRAQ